MTNWEKRLNRGRFYESLLVQHDDGRREVVKLLSIPSDLDLPQVHLDDLAEINHRLMDPDDGIHQLIIPSQVDLLDRTVIVRRPYVEGCLAQMFSMLLVDPGFKGRLDVMADGRVLEEWQLRWIAYQLVKSVLLMHQAGLAHGSLQTSNVLVDSSLSVSLVDVAPYKPFYLGTDDPTALLYYYDQEHVRYVAPERFEAGSGTDLVARQRADIYGLSVILRHLFGPTDAVNQLMESRDLSQFPPLFPVSSSVLSSVVLVLIRHWSVSGLDQFEGKLDDLRLLCKGDGDISRILCRFLIGQVQKAKDESEILRILAFIDELKPKSKCDSLVFYLEAIKGLGVTAAIITACDHIVGHTVGCTDKKALRSSTSTGQILRSLTRLCADDTDQLDIFDALRNLYPAVLIHPSGKVRRAAIKFLAKISSSNRIDDVDKVAQINWIFSKVLSVESVESTLFDPSLLCYDAVSLLLKAPLSQDLYDLVQRNFEQLPLFMSALAPEDAEKVKLVAPLLMVSYKTRFEVLTRKALEINPVLAGLDEDHAAFSPVLSDVESQEGVAIPIGMDPLSCRHFQHRRLPFQFSEYHTCVCSSSGEYIALQKQAETEVWRAADFRREILPEPWCTVPMTGPCVLEQHRMALYSMGSIIVFNLERNTVDIQFECCVSPNKIALLSAGILACGSGLSKYVGGSLEWQSDAQPEYHGPITELLVGPGEIFAVTTTSNGYVSIWDLRYGLCLRSWRLPLNLRTIHGASLCASEDCSVLLPPRIWIFSMCEETTRPCVLVVDLSVAQITHSTDRALEGLELLEDAEYALNGLDGTRLPFCHPRDAEWALACDAEGQICRCSLGPETIDMDRLHTSLKQEQIQSIHVTCPTSAESSRNLSVITLSLTGQCSITECFR